MSGWCHATSGDRFPSWKVNDKVIIPIRTLEAAGTAIASGIWWGLLNASSRGFNLE